MTLLDSRVRDGWGGADRKKSDRRLSKADRELWVLITLKVTKRAGIEGLHIWYKACSWDSAHPTIQALSRYFSTSGKQWEDDPELGARMQDK
jgi:hypothetical protein